MRRYFFLLFACGVLVGFDAFGGPLLNVSERLQPFVEQRYGAAARQRVAAWQALLAEQAGTPELQQIRAVNRFFNRIPYLPDQLNWGAADYWATPFELLGKNAGDCEDYAIAKYFSLIEMGMTPERLQITFVMETERREAHMVLTYFPSPDAEPLVLDNLTDEIRPASQRSDLIARYGINADGLWVRRGRAQGERVGRPEFIAQWADMLIRMNREIRRSDLNARNPSALITFVH